MNDTVTPDELEAKLKEKNPPKIVDVRSLPTGRATPPHPGAEWKDPEKVRSGKGPRERRGCGLLRSRRLGQQVGAGETAREERQRQVHRRGLEAWKRSGKPVRNP